MKEPTDSEMMRDAMGEALVRALPEALPKAFPPTAKELVRDPEFWAAANEGIQKHVSNKAGGWLMKSVWAMVSRIGLFLVLGSVVYAIGGWGLVAKLFGGTGK
jgi:hypothetical protein